MMKFCLSLVTLAALATSAAADDALNQCANPMPPSANVSPADDAIHLDSSGNPIHLYEQWYWNTVLVGQSKTYGVETIIFQFNFGPLILDVAQIAFTDLSTGEFHNQFVWGGGGPFLPSPGFPYVPGGFDIALTDSGGSLSAQGGGGRDLLTFQFSDGTTATIGYEGYKNPSASFFDGIGHYVDAVTGKTHGTQYYLQRRSLSASGTIQRPGKSAVAVTGVGWYDRQWGTVIGTPGSQADNVSWKWFAIHLSDDTQYMVWDMYAIDTGNSLIRVVNKMGPAPACTEQTFTNVTITGLGSTVSSAGPPPTTLENSNHISIPDDGLEIDVHMVHPGQIIESGGLFSPFLEGMTTITGKKNGRSIFGTGYYEQFAPPGGCCQGV
ncbi:MAG: lipocalin family protein [Kofleriaceae bacterium]